MPSPEPLWGVTLSLSYMGETDYTVTVIVSPGGFEVDDVCPEPETNAIYRNLHAQVTRIYRDDPEFYNDPKHVEKSWKLS